MNIPLIFSPLIHNQFCPMDSVLAESFSSFSWSTTRLNFLEIEYKVSPFELRTYLQLSTLATLIVWLVFTSCGSQNENQIAQIIPLNMKLISEDILD
jgi:hypothetical protein